MWTRSQWHRYADGVWTPLHDVAVEGEIWEQLEWHERVFGSKSRLSTQRGVLSFVRSKLYVPEDKIDTNPNLINMRNGVYDIGENLFLSHNPRFYLTTQLPFVFDPAARAPVSEMYISSTFVMPVPDNTTPDPELAEFVQEAVGYSLTADVSHHVTFWCYGEGANGKGVLFHLLEKLAGSAAVPLDVNGLRRERYQLASLPGKRVALCSEANATDNLVEDSVIKQLVAGDPMEVRPIYRSPFQLYPQAKLWWSMNRLPAVADSSKGFWRRVLVIPFNRSFEEGEVIPDLKEQLDQELPGIFNWAIAGLQRLRQRGSFTIPAQVRRATSQYQEDSNAVLSFVQDECETDQHYLVQSSALYSAYKDWAYENGYKPLSSRNLKRELEALGFYSKRLAAGVFYYGLKPRGIPVAMPTNAGAYAP